MPSTQQLINSFLIKIQLFASKMYINLSTVEVFFLNKNRMVMNFFLTCRNKNLTSRSRIILVKPPVYHLRTKSSVQLRTLILQKILVLMVVLLIALR